MVTLTRRGEETHGGRTKGGQPPFPVGLGLGREEQLRLATTGILHQDTVEEVRAGREGGQHPVGDAGVVGLDRLDIHEAAGTVVFTDVGAISERRLG